jgi:hypothetical protein
MPLFLTSSPGDEENESGSNSDSEDEFPPVLSFAVLGADSHIDLNKDVCKDVGTVLKVISSRVFVDTETKPDLTLVAYHKHSSVFSNLSATDTLPMPHEDYRFVVSTPTFADIPLRNKQAFPITIELLGGEGGSGGSPS